MPKALLLKLLLFLGCFFIFSILSSCSPRYETTYKLHPIEDPAGQDCISACDYSKDVCEKVAIYNRKRCNYLSEVKFSQCRSRRIYRFSRRTNSRICIANCVCFRDVCPLRNKTCKSDFRDCHVGCGGKITEEKKCVKYCEEAEADSSRVIDSREIKETP